MVLETRRLLDRASRWLLSNRPQPLAVGAEINRFHKVVVRAGARTSPTLLRGARGRERSRKRRTSWSRPACRPSWHAGSASLLDCYSLLDVTEVAELADRDALDTERSPRETAELYYALSDHLNIDSMLTSISALERGNRWHALARLALRDDLYSSLRAITLDVLRQSDPAPPPTTRSRTGSSINARRSAGRGSRSRRSGGSAGWTWRRCRSPPDRCAVWFGSGCFRRRGPAALVGHGRVRSRQPRQHRDAAGGGPRRAAVQRGGAAGHRRHGTRHGGGAAGRRLPRPAGGQRQARCGWR